MDHWALWIVFAVVVLTMMALDLGLHRREVRAIGVREALLRTAVWVALALGFNGLVLWQDGTTRAGEFLVCYLTEQALSVDNIFVFIVIFRYFAVTSANQHRVLFWGILGAVFFRAIFILAGVELVSRFEWTMYLLGAFLVFTGIKLFTADDTQEMDPEKNLVLRLTKKYLPVTDQIRGPHFFVVENGRRMATPLFVALLVVETTDIMFAVDSVPAALAITQDRFVLYTSNVFAILGLRSLYFAVAGIIPYLHYLQHGLSAILVFIGGKMLAASHYHIPIPVSLGVVGGVLLVSIVASVVRARMLASPTTHEPPLELPGQHPRPDAGEKPPAREAPRKSGGDENPS
ncbi:MAG: TerC family protein [Planctomycetes bacterium]|jgi:tellurite resistance protein TerC|nr:TerC family protein [Planctomycetota bacterium]